MDLATDVNLAMERIEDMQKAITGLLDNSIRYEQGFTSAWCGPENETTKRLYETNPKFKEGFDSAAGIRDE